MTYEISVEVICCTLSPTDQYETNNAYRYCLIYSHLCNYVTGFQLMCEQNLLCIQARKNQTPTLKAWRNLNWIYGNKKKNLYFLALKIRINHLQYFPLLWSWTIPFKCYFKTYCVSHFYSPEPFAHGHSLWKIISQRLLWWHFSKCFHFYNTLRSCLLIYQSFIFHVHLKWG